MTMLERWPCIVCGCPTGNVRSVVIAGSTVYEFAACWDTCAPRVEVTAMGHNPGTGYRGGATVVLRVSAPVVAGSVTCPACGRRYSVEVLLEPPAPDAPEGHR